MGVCFMFYLGIATAASVRVAEGYRAGQSGRGEECRSPGRGRHDGDGVILGVLLVSLAGPISRLLVREDAIIRGIAIAPAIAALLWLAAAYRV